jgi:ribosomal protein S18 acetylase RimI-like enzyme
VVTKIVEARVEDWAQVREIRLRALADAPHAFASRLADEQDRPELVWRDRLMLPTASTYLALDDGESVGLVTVFLDPENQARAHLVSMWVTPSWRRRAVGTALTRAVLDWAHRNMAQTVDLWVTETNDAARRMYERCGFVESGNRQPLRSHPGLQELGMTCRVEAARGSTELRSEPF